VITTRSPYIARTSFTLWQSSYPLGQWAAKKFKTGYTLVSDFGPGHDAEEGFIKAFTEGGGKMLGNVRVPLQNPDWAAYMQRVKDAKPDCADGVHPGGQDRHRGDEELLRPGPRQGRHQADRAGRHHHRRGAAQHGRRGARRAHRAPLLRRGYAA
jgi:hypothetical protein